MTTDDTTFAHLDLPAHINPEDHLGVEYDPILDTPRRGPDPEPKWKVLGFPDAAQYRRAKTYGDGTFQPGYRWHNAKDGRGIQLQRIPDRGRPLKERSPEEAQREARVLRSGDWLHKHGPFTAMAMAAARWPEPQFYLTNDRALMVTKQQNTSPSATTRTMYEVSEVEWFYRLDRWVMSGRAFPIFRAPRKMLATRFMDHVPRWEQGEPLDDAYRHVPVIAPEKRYPDLYRDFEPTLIPGMLYDYMQDPEQQPIYRKTPLDMKPLLARMQELGWKGK